MEGCFPFQWGRVCFSDRGGFIFKWGVHLMGEVLVLMEGLKKNCKMGVVPPTMGTPVVGYFCWEGVNTPLDAMHHGNLELHLPPV